MVESIFGRLRTSLLSMCTIAFMTVSIITVFGMSPLSFASTMPPGFVEAKIASGFDRPTQMQIAPDGRIFVLQQGGKVIIYKNGTKLATPFITL